MSNITKKDLAETIHSKMGYPTTTCTKIVESFIDSIKSSLLNGSSVKIVNFGTLNIKNKKPRKGRNPHTGETITISKRKMISFRTGKKLKESINK